MTLNFDITSTILDYAGIVPPVSWHGKSLVPLVSGEEGNWRRDTVLMTCNTWILWPCFATN